MKTALFYLLRSVSLLFIIFAAGNEESVTIISNQTIFMNNQYIRLLLAVVYYLLFDYTPTTSPRDRRKDKREFRAWIQTAFQGEYKDMTPPSYGKISCVS